MVVRSEPSRRVEGVFGVAFFVEVLIHAYSEMLGLFLF